MEQERIESVLSKLIGQRLPAFVTRLLREKQKLKVKPMRKHQRQFGKMMRR